MNHGEISLYAADSMCSDESQNSQVMPKKTTALPKSSPPKPFMTAGFRFVDPSTSTSNIRSAVPASAPSGPQHSGFARGDSMKENTPTAVADIPGLSLTVDQTKTNNEGQKAPARVRDISFAALACDTETPPASQLFQTPQSTPTPSAPKDNPRSQSPTADDYFPPGQPQQAELEPPEPTTPTASQPSTPTGLQQPYMSTTGLANPRSLLRSLDPEKQQRYLERHAAIIGRQQGTTQPSTISDARATGPFSRAMLEETQPFDISQPESDEGAGGRRQVDNFYHDSEDPDSQPPNLGATQPLETSFPDTGLIGSQDDYDPAQEIDTSGYPDVTLSQSDLSELTQDLDVRYPDGSQSEHEPTQATQNIDTSNYPDLGVSGSGSPLNSPVVIEETQEDDTSHYLTTGLLSGVDDRLSQRSSSFANMRHELTPLARQSPRRRGADYSDMDIVPDSEATEPSNEELIHPPPLSPAPSNPDISMQSNLDEEVIPDSHPGASTSIPIANAGSDSESEDDIPLARHGRKEPARKRPRKESSGSLMPPPKRSRTAPSSPTKEQVVPSPHPKDEEPLRADKDTPGKRVMKKPSTPSTPARRKRPREATPEESDVETGSLLAKTEVCTEPADDDYMDMVASTKTAGTRRRKGTASARSSVRKTRTVSVTPSLRSNKKTKSASKSFSAARANSGQTIRVFAHWRDDNHYYSGSIDLSSSSSSGKYHVAFDDGTHGIVDLKLMRRCEPRSGDHVIINGTGQKAIVTDAARSDSDDILTVRCSQNGEILEIRNKDVRIASRSISSQWKDRIIEDVDGPPQTNEQATPSNRSDVGTWSSRTKKPLARMGVVLSLTVGCDGWMKLKDELTTLIRNNGGTVYEDWCEVFKMDGVVSAGGNRLVLKKDDVRPMHKNGLDRVFLLADDASHKVKYLMALGLGIPCLHFDWVRHCMEEQSEKDWQPYLLSAGTSVVLGARVSQMVDLDWGNTSLFVDEITENHVAAKLFADKVVLCISPDYVPGKQTNRKGTVEEEKAYRGVPRIILCMGATEVEAVADAWTASRKLQDYDYVVVKDSAAMQRIKTAHSSANCVHLPWVKECLVTGRLLPINHPQLPSS